MLKTDLRRLYTSRAVAAQVDPDDMELVATLPRAVVSTTDAGEAGRLNGPDGAMIVLFLEHGYARAEPMRLLPGFTCRSAEVHVSFPPHRTEVPAVGAFVDLLVEHTARIASDPADDTARSPSGMLVSR